MKKIFISLVCLMLALVTVAFTVGCSENKAQAALAYDDGINDDGAYDTDIFYRNDLLLNHAADPDVLWVPKDRDATWGGYYYLYTTNVYYNIIVMRSKDLNNWEKVGMALDFDGTQWCTHNIWAPEVAYDPVTQKYYMYASGQRASDVDKNTHYEMFVAVSDNPANGFKLHTAQDAYGDYYGTSEPNLSFNVDHTSRKLGEEFDWITSEKQGTLWCIDPNPFYDEGQWYLYFRARWEVNGIMKLGMICVVKMIDMVTPDYGSFKELLYANYQSAEDYRNGKTFPMETVSNSDINEAPHMIKHDGVYYLTYAFGRYQDRTVYCVAVSVSDSPMGDFIKLDPSDGNPSLYMEGYMDQMSGPGHHCFVETGDEIFVVYHSLMNRATGNSNPRGIAIDRVEFIDGSAFGIKASDYGIETQSGTFDVLYTNGATWSLQPAPAAVSEYENIAVDAKITTNDAGDPLSVKYLNDKIFANHTYSKDFEFNSPGETVITLTWDEPVTIRAVMIYNSFDFEYAFSKIDRLDFTLAEQPVAWTGERLDSVYIKNLKFNENYYNSDESFMRPGGSAHASFDEIKVTQITVRISEKLDTLKATGDALKVSEIVVLGRSDS